MSVKTKTTLKEIATLSAWYAATSAFVIAQSLFWS